jgi:hypothetical protein
MKLIERNSEGLEVKHWQAFLKKQNLYTGEPNGKFDDTTHIATSVFQSKNNLDHDGVVGKDTLTAAKNAGFVDIFLLTYPGTPSFRPLLTLDEKSNIFGKFTYRAEPLPDNKENIVITDSWEDNNIITIDIPQLIPIKGDAIARFHKLAAPKAIKLFSDWEKAGLMDRVISWEGAFVPRFIRNSTTTLSQHAYGSAFDINADWNGLNKIPAMIGQKGCVRELVQIAHENGFFWGGHFRYKNSDGSDGMHFELAVIDGAASRGGDIFETESFSDFYEAEGQDPA